MKDYFNLSFEERRALMEKRERPAAFAKATVEETTTETTTENIVEQFENLT